MGSKRFSSILQALTNGSSGGETADDPNPAGRGAPTRRDYIRTMPPEERKKVMALAHEALSQGLTVFMSRETVNRFDKLLGTKVTSRFMRRLLAEIANGGVVLTRPTIVGKTPQPTAALYREPTTSPTLGRALPTVLSVNQLTGELPLSLKQAARVLNVTANQLYYRCVTGRIHFERSGSHYYIPALEIDRLRIVGL